MERDYVLATKYSDGNPQDQWCVGFWKGMTENITPRYLVVDDNGKPFRHNGFRRVANITKEEGQYLLDNKDTIRRCQQSLWWHLDKIRGTIEEPSITPKEGEI